MSGSGRTVFQMWVDTPNGPIVSGDLRQALGLSDSQVEAVNKVFVDAGLLACRRCEHSGDATGGAEFPAGPGNRHLEAARLGETGGQGRLFVKRSLICLDKANGMASVSEHS